MTDRIWPGGKGLVVSLVVNVEEGAQMSAASGDRCAEPVDELGVVLGDGQANLANDSNYQYGLTEGFHRVAKVLQETGACATWTCAALALKQSPHIARFISARNDEVACHGLRWVHQFRQSRNDESTFIKEATAVLESVCGRRPVGYLARYLFTANTRRLLAEHGYRYDMNDYSADFPFWDRTEAGPIVVLPYALDTNDMKMWTAPSYTPDDWRKYLLDTFEYLSAEGKTRPVFMSAGVHLRVVGRPGRINAWRDFIEHLVSRGAVIARRVDICERFAQLHPLEEQEQ